MSHIEIRMVNADRQLKKLKKGETNFKAQFNC